ILACLYYLFSIKLVEVQKLQGIVLLTMILSLIIGTKMAPGLIKKYTVGKCAAHGLLIVALGVFFLGWARSDQVYKIFVGACFCGWGTGLLTPTFNTIWAYQGEEDERGLVLGLQSTIKSLGESIAPLLSGFLFDIEDGGKDMYLFLVACNVVAALLVVSLEQDTKDAPKPRIAIKQYRRSERLAKKRESRENAEAAGLSFPSAPSSAIPASPLSAASFPGREGEAVVVGDGMGDPDDALGDDSEANDPDWKPNSEDSIQEYRDYVLDYKYPEQSRQGGERESGVSELLTRRGGESSLSLKGLVRESSVPNLLNRRETFDYGERGTAIGGERETWGVMGGERETEEQSDFDSIIEDMYLGTYDPETERNYRELLTSRNSGYPAYLQFPQKKLDIRGAETVSRTMDRKRERLAQALREDRRRERERVTQLSSVSLTTPLSPCALVPVTPTKGSRGTKGSSIGRITEASPLLSAN
ncbi:major facilitator superfamily protein, partial [Kipferlia bialata]